MTSRLPVLDLHLHLVALDPRETDGGFFNERRRRTTAFRLIRRVAGLPARDADFDQHFRDHLAALLRDAQTESAFTAVGLAFDRPHDHAGHPLDAEADFHVSDAYALRLARRENGRLLAGASIHPYRPDALEALARATAGGAVLVKWLPTSQGIDPADPRTRAFAGACVRLGLPLLIHTGSEGATRNRHPEWNNPRALEPLLDAGATVVAAHAGMRSFPNDADHFQTWIEMLPHWPRLYGDTAALFGLRPRKLLRALDRPHVVDRFVHGSDWPVPNAPHWYWPFLDVGTIRRLARIRNPLRRDVAVKRAAGLPEDIFTRGWSLLPARAPLIPPSRDPRDQ